MAYSTQRAVSDGTMTYLDVSINFQYQSDISVFYDDLPAGAGTWAWSSTTSKRIVFTSAIANGVEVLVKRATTMSKVINVFASGAKFNNASMDTNFQQMLFLTQEAVEGAALTDIFNDVDFHGYKIKNLGTATDSTDAITYGQVQTMSNGAYTAQLAAQAAQAASEAARDLAQKWASQLTTTVDGTSYSAKQYALNATTYAAQSSTYATNSANSATASAASATASANSATSSSTYATNSANSATAAAASAQAAEDAAEPAQELIDGVAAAQTDAANAVTTANAVSTTLPGTAMPFHCRLTGTTTVLTLARYAGSKLFINGAVYTIPSAGVTYTASGLTASTVYYVYAYMNGSTMTLEVSTTAYTADTTYGHPIKTGDATRVLVGKAYASSATTFGATYQILSYYNRARISYVNAFTGQGLGTTSNTTIASVGMLVWPDDRPKLTYYGYWASGAAGQVAFDFMVDGVTPTSNCTQASNATTAAIAIPIGMAITVQALSGSALHTFSVVGRQVSATATHTANATLSVDLLG